ncbi:MAG: hypothetical protein LBI08_03185 [Methanomassiliicoccaceae archaeon]|jgi:hypothetical protein|nr:hypothetical protein [Methanomassiliicoccaceae archaeon]
MRYSITRLCGGKALMASPRETLDIDMREAANILSGKGEIKSVDDMMLVMSWKGMEVTLYAQGKVMFHPLDSRDLAITYADEILGGLVG